MALPSRVTVEDIQALCSYLATKATGAALKEISGVVDAKHLDARKVSAMVDWHLIEEMEGKYRVTADGRDFIKTEQGKNRVLSDIIRRAAPYLGIIERVAHRHEETLTATEVAAHWHEHFKDEVSPADDELNRQAVTFFQIAGGVGLGTLVIGRRGQPTRFSFNLEAVSAFVSGTSTRQL